MEGMSEWQVIRLPGIWVEAGLLVVGRSA